MNHASEWMTFFDERAGRYLYKPKGSGVVRDTLMAIRKVFTQGATQVAKKPAKAAAKKSRHRRLRGAEQQLLRKRRSQKVSLPPSEVMLKLSRILANRL